MTNRVRLDLYREALIRLRPLLLVVAAIPLSLIAIAHARAQVHQADVDVIQDSAYRQKFDIDPIYPGQTLKLSASGGPVEVNTRSEQKRRCKVRIFVCVSYQYYTVTHPNPKNPDQYPVTVRLVTGGGGTVWTDKEIGTSQLALEYGWKLADPTGRKFTTGARVHAKLAELTGEGERVIRYGCTGTPGDFCSSGSFQLSLAIDASIRLRDYLPQYLSVRQAVGEILSDSVIDPNSLAFLATDAGRPLAEGVATALVNYAKKFLNQESDLDYFVAILDKAKQIYPQAIFVDRELGSKYVEVGVYDEAKVKLLQYLNAAEAQLTSLSSWTEYQNVAKSRRDLAVAFTEDYAGIVGAEMLKADQSYEIGIGHLEEGIKMAPSHSERDILIGQLRRMSLERAQHLMRIRTIPSLHLAQSILKRFTTELGLFLPGQPIGTDADNTLMLLGDDVGSLLYDVPEGSQIHVASVPTDIRSPLDVQSVTESSDPTVLGVDLSGNPVLASRFQPVTLLHSRPPGTTVADGRLANPAWMIAIYEPVAGKLEGMLEIGVGNERHAIPLNDHPKLTVSSAWRPADLASHGRLLVWADAGSFYMTDVSDGSSGASIVTGPKACQLPSNLGPIVRVEYGASGSLVISEAMGQFRFTVVRIPADGADDCEFAPLNAPEDRRWLAGGRFSADGSSLVLLSSDGLFSWGRNVSAVSSGEFLHEPRGGELDHQPDDPTARPAVRFHWNPDGSIYAWKRVARSSLHLAQLRRSESGDVLVGRHDRTLRSYSEPAMVLTRLPGLDRPTAYVSWPSARGTVVTLKDGERPVAKSVLVDDIKSNAILLSGGDAYIDFVPSIGHYRVVDVTKLGSPYGPAVPQDLQVAGHATTNGEISLAVDCCGTSGAVRIVPTTNGNGVHVVSIRDAELHVSTYLVGKQYATPQLVRSCTYPGGSAGAWVAAASGRESLSYARRVSASALSLVWQTGGYQTVLYRNDASSTRGVLVALADPSDSSCASALDVSRPADGMPLHFSPSTKTAVWLTGKHIVVQELKPNGLKQYRIAVPASAHTIIAQVGAAGATKTTVVGWAARPADPKAAPVGGIVRLEQVGDGSFQMKTCDICAVFSAQVSFDAIARAPVSAASASAYRIFALHSERQALAVAGLNAGVDAVVIGKLDDPAASLKPVEGQLPVFLGEGFAIVRLEDGRLVSRIFD